jgi:hypothetical protein
MTEPLKKDLRPLAMGLAVAAAACLIFAAFTRQWLVNAGRYTEYGFGLRDNYQCMTSYGESSEQQCQEMTNSAVVEMFASAGPRGEKMSSAAFVPMGWVTFVVSLLAALGLLGAAFLAFKKIQRPLPVAPTSIGLLFGMIGLITGCVFVATKPGPPGMVGVGVSFWVFGVGTVMGIAASQMLAKLTRPPEPEWTAE